MDQDQVLLQISTAAAMRRPVTLKYRDRKGQETVREVLPFAAFDFMGDIYVHAFCALRKARRTFRLSCIEVQGVDDKPDKDWNRKLARANADVPVLGNRLF